MNAIENPVLIYAVYPDPNSAEEAGRALVGTGLAACVNILPGMTSIYRWEGNIERGSECVMFIKTRDDLAEAAMADARSRHPYTTPAFVVLPIAGGLPSYIEWIIESTTKPAR